MPRSPPRTVTPTNPWAMRSPAIRDVRAHPFLGVPELLSELGVDPGAILARAGIDARAFEHPEHRVSFQARGRLLIECRAATGCPHFGLLVGQRAGAGVLGLIGELARQSSSVQDGLRSIILHMHLHDRGASLLLKRGPIEAVLAYLIHAPGMQGAAQVCDASAVIMYGVLRGLCGPGWRPSALTFAHWRPPDVMPYRAFFGCHLVFDAPRTAVIFPAHWLDTPIPDADPLRHAQIIGLLARARASVLSDVVRQVVCEHLMHEWPSGERVARALGISRRTLYRRLVDEGTRLHTVTTEVRCALAR